MKKILFFISTLICLSGAIHAQKNPEADNVFKSAEQKSANGLYKEAEAEYTKAISLDDKNANYYLKRGFSRIQLQDYQGAIEDYSKVIESHPNNKYAYLSRGAAYNKIKDFKNGLEDFNKVLQIDPKDQEAYNNRGWSKKGLGDDSGACEDWNKSKKMGNDEAKIILKNNHCK